MTRRIGIAIAFALIVGLGASGASASTSSRSGGAQRRDAAPTPIALVNRFQEIDASPGTDSLTATAPAAGVRSWSAAIENFGAGALPEPQISLDGSSQTFSPPLAFPLSAGPGPDLADGDFELPQLGTSQVHTTLTSGFDLSRSVSPASIPAGGGVQDVTVSITPRDPRDAYGISLIFEPSSPAWNATIVSGSVVLPTLGDGEVINPQSVSGGIYWSIYGAVIGKTYTLTLQLDVPNAGTAAVAYEPEVTGEGFWQTTFPDDVGQATTIHDDVLGGNFAFGAADSETWERALDDYSYAALPEAPPPPAPSSAYVMETRLHETDVAPSVDSIAATTSTIGWRGWDATLDDSGLTSLSSPQIALDTVSPSWAFTPPVGPFPLTQAQASLDAGSAMGLEALSGYIGGTSRANGTSMSTGYNATRSVSVTSNPDGSSVAHVSVTVTAVDPRWAGQSLTISVSPSDGSGGSGIVADPTSVVFPDLSAGGTEGFTQAEPDFVQWSVGSPTLGHPYTLTLDVDLPAGTTNTAVYRPGVQFYGSVGSGSTSSTGTSTTIADPELGGTWTFSAADTVDWSDSTWDAYVLNFAGVDPTPPAEAQATDQRLQFQDLGSGVDSVGATDSVLGELGWRATIQNFNPAPVTAPSISLDTSSQSFTPSVTFPIGAGPGSDLDTGDELDLSRLASDGGGNSTVHGATIQTGYDAARSFDTTTIPAGGGSQTVTVTITPRDASYEGGAIELRVDADWYGGSTASIDTAGVTTSPLTDEFASSPYLSAQEVDWKVFDVHVGHTYTLTVPIHIDNPGAGSFPYKPMVFAYGYRDTYPAPTTGTSTTIADPVLGGTFTFSSGSVVQWTHDLEDIVSTSFEPIQEPAPPAVDHFSLRLSRSTVEGGQPLQVTITARDASNHAVRAYTGPVDLDDTQHTLAVTTQPSFVNGVGTATVTLVGPYSGDRITVGDGSGASPAAGGTSSAVNVIGPPTHFTVRAAATSVNAGAPLTVTVTARDGLNRVVPSYGGPLGWSDSNGPLAPTSESWVSGVDTALLVLPAPTHADVISVLDGSGLAGSPAGSSGHVTVLGSVDHFIATVTPGTFGAGSDATLTVTAKDAANDTLAAYAGTPALSDLSGTVVTDGVWSWTNGVGRVSFVISMPTKADRVTVADGAASGQSGTFNVYGPVSSFRVAVSPSSAAVGADLAVTATALDVNGLAVQSYSGPVTVTDANTTPPVVSTALAWTNGVGRGSVQVDTATHADRLTVADGAASGQSGAFNVLGPVTHFKVTAAPATITVGTQQLTVTTTAQDAANNTIAAYAGPVTYADANGPSTVHLVSESWTNGVDTARLTISTRKTGDTLTVGDAAHPAVSGTSNTFTVH